MHYTTEDAFSTAFKQAKPHGVYLLYGSENYLIAAWAKKITGQFGKDFSSFNMQKLDGRKLDCDALYDATEALPLMAGEKCVLVEDIDIAKLPAGEMKKLEEIVSDLAPSCVLVITARPPAFDAKSAAGKKFIKLVGTAGNAVELGTRSQSGLVAFLKSTAKKHHCEISTDLCKYILQTCENDMGALVGEMAKVCAYAGGGQLEARHVDAVVIPKTEARVFDLSKAILAGNTQRAMEILANLFYLREAPLSILSVLTMAYVDMYRARVAKNNGGSVADIMTKFGYKSDYRVRNAFGNRLSVEYLRRALDELYDCDRRLKSTGMDDKILLELTVTRLFALGAG